MTRTRLHAASRTRTSGVLLASGAALVSGVSVFVNSYGVKRVADPTVYTTAKNLVAAAALLVLLAAASSVRGARGWTPPSTRQEWLGLGVIAVFGGSVPFVLFFEGLARSSSTDAQLINKTLVVWVALLAVPLLGERVGGLHVVAIALLIAGQAQLAGGLPSIARSGRGEAMVLAATLLWAVEVVVAKRLLASLSAVTVATARMAIGSLVLVSWLATTGRLQDLAGLSSNAWAWTALTGSLLTLYVATWYSALARAQAVDVTAVLVAAALVTSVLDALVNEKPFAPQRTGLLAILAGAMVAGLAALIARTGPGSAVDAGALSS